jgi:hypothetical protein
MSNNKSNNKKKVVMDFSKKEKKVKDTLLLDVNLYELVDGLVNGFVYTGKKVKRFGKEYFKCENKVSSL